MAGGIEFNYKKTPPVILDKVRDAIAEDVEAFLAGGGKIDKHPIRIGPVVEKRTQKQNREAIRTQGWKNLNTQETGGTK
jgi:hypothetical protein